MTREDFTPKDNDLRKARDISARQLYSELEAKMFTKPNGIFLRDIVNEKMEADDARLR